MMRSIKKVLVVDDEGDQHDKWFVALGDKVGLNGEIAFISAVSVREAKDRFADNPDVAAVVMDACVPGDLPNTASLVRTFRTAFAGPMIAASNDRDYRNQLLQAGCDHESTKQNLPQTLLRVLGL